MCLCTWAIPDFSQHSWKVYNFSSTTNFLVIHPLPKDIFLHCNWRIWITGESQCPRSILISSLAGGSIEEEWSYTNNRWDRKYGNDNMLVKHILPGTSLLLALDHVFPSKFLLQNQKNLVILLLFWSHPCRVFQTLHSISFSLKPGDMMWVSHVNTVLHILWLTAVLCFEIWSCFCTISNFI